MLLMRKELGDNRGSFQLKVALKTKDLLIQRAGEGN